MPPPLRTRPACPPRYARQLPALAARRVGSSSASASCRQRGLRTHKFRDPPMFLLRSQVLYFQHATTRGGSPNKFHAVAPGWTSLYYKGTCLVTKPKEMWKALAYAIGNMPEYSGGVLGLCLRPDPPTDHRSHLINNFWILAMLKCMLQT